MTRGDVVLDDARDCLVLAERRLVACAGVRDLAVIETDDVVLVAASTLVAIRDANRLFSGAPTATTSLASQQ